MPATKDMKTSFSKGSPIRKICHFNPKFIPNPMLVKIECSLMLLRTVFIKHMFLAVLSDQKSSLKCLDTV
jgi:hypothetical protein